MAGTVTKVVRYRTRPECAEENAELVRAVYAELAASQPPRFRYVTFRLDDGVTFIHVAQLSGDNPLLASAAFGRFTSTIGERCDEPPVALDASVVGAYGFPADTSESGPTGPTLRT